MKSVQEDADSVNYAALLVASSVVSVVVLILVALPLTLFWYPAPSVYSLLQLPAMLGLMVGACLIAFTTAFAALSARNEARFEPYVEASLKRLGVLYVVFHLTFSAQMLFRATWEGVLLGPLVYVIFSIVPYGDFMRAGAALGAIIVVGLFGAPTIGWLYWRFSQGTVFSKLRIAPPHARSAVAAAVAAAALSGAGHLVALGLLSGSLIGGNSFLFFVARIPLEAIAALSAVTFVACVAAYYRSRLKQQLELVGWITMFAIVAIAMAVVSRLAGFAILTVWSPGDSTFASRFRLTSLYFMAPDIVAYCVSAYIYARGVGARRWTWAGPV